MSRPHPISRLPSLGPAVVTMGVFDGVHLGHQRLLDATRSTAGRLGVASVALVFEPHPDQILHPGTVVPRLAPLTENLRRIRERGIDHPLAIRFDDALRTLQAEAFVAGLAPAIELRGLVMTAGSAFGRGRGGTIDHMRELGRGAGFEVVEVPVLMADGEPLSSSRLRAALASGDLATLRRFGGVGYLEGQVGRGEGRGHLFGYPSARLALHYAALLPPHGVWSGWATFPDDPQRPPVAALVSVGTRPMFHRAGRPVVEAYLLEAEEDLVGRRVGLELVAYLREERRFGSEAELAAQLDDDVRRGRTTLRADG